LQFKQTFHQKCKEDSRIYYLANAPLHVELKCYGPLHIHLEK